MPIDNNETEQLMKQVALGRKIGCSSAVSMRATALRTSRSEMFWAPPHAIPGVNVGKGRQIHLINSRDGLAWEYVSTVAPFENASESTLRCEEDRTMVVLIRRKYAAHHSVAVAKPPYRGWELTERPGIIEGEHFFDIGGRTFLASRALYSGDDPDVKANPRIVDGRRSYSIIYTFTRGRRLERWAVMDSMGDCSYSSLVETPTEILCGYYSQHHDKLCKVYLCGFHNEEFLRGNGDRQLPAKDRWDSRPPRRRPCLRSSCFSAVLRGCQRAILRPGKKACFPSKCRPIKGQFRVGGTKSAFFPLFGG